MRLTGTVACSAWVERAVAAMGSTAVLIVGDAPVGSVEWALDELARLEQCWSRFRADSELTALNSASGDWFEMSATLSDAVDRALRLSASTGGLFDPTIHASLVALGYDRPFRQVEREHTVPVCSPGPAPGVAGIERRDQWVRVPAGVHLDLGGVGKGLAADRVAVGLIARGARSVCVSLGGDIRVAGGVPDEGGWRIPVTDPHDPDRSLGTIAVADAAIVTSTTGIRSWRRGGTTHHHLIDPRSGRSSTSGVRAVVAMAPEAWFAEGVAKAALLAGPIAGRALLDRLAVGGFVITDDRTCSASEWAPPLGASPLATP